MQINTMPTPQKIYVIFAKASQTVKSIIDNGTDIN